MKITIRIGDTEVIVDRPNFKDYEPKIASDSSGWRKNMFNDTVLPTLEKAVEKCKELHKFKTECTK